ncbi:hypothetical protein SAMN06298216_3554 [Spirosomataceae bacterium TFI 002]|nr:hypothetical protein SAMN06298216_3554 [Spirosomataceae bacterium TFI 002]
MKIQHIANEMSFPCFLLCRANGLAGGILIEVKTLENFEVPKEELTEFHFFNQKESSGARLISGKWFPYHFNDESGIKHIDEQVIMHPEIAKAGGLNSNDREVPGFIKRTYFKIHEVGHHYYPVAQRYIDVISISKKSKTVTT